jgi:hypothetical protein
MKMKVTRENLFPQEDPYARRQRDMDALRAEREEMKKWAPAYKSDWNIKRFFKTHYLLRVGYSEYLNGQGGVTDWKRELTPDDLSEHFVWVFNHKDPAKYAALTADLVRFFTEHPEEIFVPTEIYAKHLPPQLKQRGYKHLYA